MFTRYPVETLLKFKKINEYSRDNKLICITSESSGELMFLVMWFWMTENGGGIVNYMKCSLLSSSTAISKLSLLQH